AVGAFFFSSRRRHTRFSRDWSSDVCSSDLVWQSLWGRNKSRFPIGQGRSGHLSFYSLGRDCLYHKKLLHPSRQPLYRESPEPDRSEERRVGKECRSGWPTELATTRRKALYD